MYSFRHSSINIEVVGFLRCLVLPQRGASPLDIPSRLLYYSVSTMGYSNSIMKFKLQDKRELALSLVVLLITVGLFLQSIQNYTSSDAPAVHKGRIVDITEENLQGYTDIKSGYQELEIEVLDGEYRGQVIPGVNILIYDYAIDLNLVTSMFLEAVSGSIGLVLTIPTTVILGAYFYSR